MATKAQIKNLKLRVETLKAELADPYTVSLGKAAVACVQETLDVTEAELRRAMA